jgi:hypothetical protein
MVRGSEALPVSATDRESSVPAIGVDGKGPAALVTTRHLPR